MSFHKKNEVNCNQHRGKRPSYLEGKDKRNERLDRRTKE